RDQLLGHAGVDGERHVFGAGPGLCRAPEHAGERVMNQRPLSRHSARAFTLIETVLALGLMAMVLAAITGVFFSALRLRERTADTVDNALPAQQATAILRRDLQCAMAPGGILARDFKVGSISELNLRQPVAIEMY